MRRQMSDYQRGVGQRLKALRISKQASQEAAARIAGVSTTTWRNWERGLRAPYERNWRKIADGFVLTEEEVAAIRGQPPTPLGLAADRNGEEAEVVSLLREQNELLANVAAALGDLMALALEAQATWEARSTTSSSGRRKATGS